jgi:hypothetical protein
MNEISTLCTVHAHVVFKFLACLVKERNKFKGTVSRDGYFFEGLNSLIGTCCMCADGFQGLSKAFHYPINCIKFLFASLKLLINFENAY